MKTHDQVFGGFLMGIVVATIIWILMVSSLGDSSVFYQHGYKQGQIDYANSIKKYELTKMEDGTTQWVEVKKMK